MDMNGIFIHTFVLFIFQLELIAGVQSTNHYVTYKGFGDLVLTCNESDLINITKVSLTNHVTCCSRQTCFLSENDTSVIENCNNKSTCTIPVHDMTGCIKEKGLYNVRYSCKSTALTCDFDYNTCQIEDYKSSWRVVEAGSAGDGFRDLTTYSAKGRLMFFKDGHGQSDETKITNRVYSSPKQCLSFYYWGNDLGNLTVSREGKDGFIDTVDHFPNAKHRWERFMRNLYNIGDYHLRFKTTGYSRNHKILIDDITIINAECNESRANELTCDFDDNICQIQEDNSPWRVAEAGTARYGYWDRTTYSENGRLLFVKNGQSGEATITNRVYSSPKQCLSFYYSGNNIGHLSVSRERIDESINSVDHVPNANGWNRFMRNLTDIGDYYLRFKATGIDNSLFMIDDITIINADCGGSRDDIQFNETCRKLEDVTELKGCSKYYIENVNFHFNPLEEICRTLINDSRQVCTEFNDSIYCDLRTVVNSNPSCFNRNTLIINYTCTSETEQMKNDRINIGAIIAAVFGLLLIVNLMSGVICVIYRNRKLIADSQRQSVSWNINVPVTSLPTPVNRLESMDPSSQHTDTNPVTSDSEHRHMAISMSYRSIIEPLNEDVNNENPGPVYENQLPYIYTTLDSSGIENTNPNIYDDLSSPSFNNTDDDIATVNHYEEPMPGGYTDCFVLGYEHME